MTSRQGVYSSTTVKKRHNNNIRSLNFAASENKMKPQAALFHANRGSKLNPLGARNSNMGIYASTANTRYDKKPTSIGKQ